MPPLTKEELLAQSESLWQYPDPSFEEEDQKWADKLWQAYLERYPHKRTKKELEDKRQETEVKS